MNKSDKPPLLTPTKFSNFKPDNLLFSFDNYEVYPASMFHHKQIVESLTEELMLESIIAKNQGFKHSIDSN